MTVDEQKSTPGNTERATLGAQSRPAHPQVSEAERKLKKAERSALLMQVAAIEEYLGIKRRCKKCGEDI